MKAHCCLIAVLILCLSTAVAHAGNSFDDFVAERGGVIPHPFSELFRALGRTSATLIPDGRSRQRASASVRNPRFVVARGQPDFLDPPTLFIGYSPLAQQLEVIAWNQEKGRFDFIEVTQYEAGKQPRIEQPPRSQCLSCHQNAAPIFPRFPWSETLFNLKTVEAILDARGGDPAYHGLKFDDVRMPSLVGTDVAVDPAKLDTLVRQANRRLQIAPVCRELCGENSECRRKILLAALIDPSWRFRGDRKARELRDRLAGDLRARFVPSWPTGGFEYPSSILPDRDPFTVIDEARGMAVIHEIRDRSGLLEYAHPELFPERLLLTADLNFEDLLTDFVLSSQRGFKQRYIPFRPGNPSHPQYERPLVSAILPESSGAAVVRSAFDCLGFKHEASSAYDWLASREPGWLEGAAARVDVSLWPVNAARVLKQLQEMQ